MKEIKIDLPRLTDRPEDIEVLCEFFLDKHAPKGESKVTKQFHPDALDILRAYSWPGNVRELENLIKRLSILVEGYIILPEHVEKYGELEATAMLANPLNTLESLVEMQIRHENEARALILRTYQACDQNLSETARKLGVARTSLRSQCQALGIWESMDTVTKVDESENKKDLKRRVDKSLRNLLSRVVEV